MPRLIDFDKLMEQYDFYNEFAVHDLRYLKEEYLPFVDAIPIKWLIENAREYFADIEIAHLDCMITDWRLQNEIDRCR